MIQFMMFRTIIQDVKMSTRRLNINFTRYKTSHGPDKICSVFNTTSNSSSISHKPHDFIVHNFGCSTFSTVYRIKNHKLNFI